MSFSTIYDKIQCPTTSNVELNIAKKWQLYGGIRSLTELPGVSLKSYILRIPNVKYRHSVYLVHVVLRYEKLTGFPSNQQVVIGSVINLFFLSFQTANTNGIRTLKNLRTSPVNIIAKIWSKSQLFSTTNGKAKRSGFTRH